ncbi:MAG: EF2563 family selenium-dependent molybdenum hydroxylase system protein [Desulfomonile tiedjei]|nr:EF2563 family selenium-dependent molybdenum hydroxylase system protein [Desulfomonile tiedjei]
MPNNLFDLKIMIRGAGEMATGTACRLHRSGFYKILMTEVAQPLAVRRLVSFCDAVYQGTTTVEGVQAVAISTPDQAVGLWNERLVPVLVDPKNNSRTAIKPDIIVDAILAKRNLGTGIGDATLVIGLGPGFCAGRDVHCVIETNRGHNLARPILDGEADPDTGIPGDIGGATTARVLRAPADGVFESDLEIGAFVKKGQTIGHVSGKRVTAGVGGVLRGLIRSSTPVNKGLKIGDVDPRENVQYCSTISEKARAIGGSVLEAILARFNQP